MSIYSQFISKFTLDANSYTLGEIVSYPSTINGPATLDSNNFVKTGGTYETTNHSSLSGLLGRINAYNFKPNTSIYGVMTGLRKSESLMYIVVSNKVYKANQSNDLQEISDFGNGNTLPNITYGGSHRLRYNYEKELFLLAGPGNGFISTSTDAVTWNKYSANTGVSSYFFGVEYGNGIYLALGYDNSLGRQIIRTSTNLTDWSQYPNIRANNSSTIRSSIYGNGKYVLVGDSGVVKTSANGLVWADETSGTSSILRAVTFGNQLFVYAGDGGVLASSTDAVTWTARTSNSSNNITTLAYSDGIFIYGTSNGSIGRSTDGTSWTFYPGVVTNTIYSSAAKSGLYVVGADAGKVATSTNGITWTSRANVTINLAVGQSEYTTPGSYSWTAPTGVTSVSVVCVGGGGGAYRFNLSSINGYYYDFAGGGGGLGWKNNISVTPGSSYSLNVGRGGIGFEDSGSISSANTFYFKGSNSWFNSEATVVGGGAGLYYGQYGGSFVGDGGSDGGDGSTSVNYYYYDQVLTGRNANAGGAGGYGRMYYYTEGGGNGYTAYSANNIYEGYQNGGFPEEPYFPRRGGGGSGGYASLRGGGVGIWGQGVNGNSVIYLEGSDPSLLSSYGSRLFGGGGAQVDYFFPFGYQGSSGNGAVRIVWGPNRQYSNTSNVYLIGNIAAGSVETDDFYSMAYANGIFLGGSANGRIFTSTDAVTWSLSYGAGNNRTYLANTILSLSYVNNSYMYGDSRGQLGFVANTSNVWGGSNGYFGANSILTIATNGNDVVYAGSNGWIGKADNGFTEPPIRTPSGATITYYDFLYDNATRQFAFVGTYGSIFVSESNIVNNFKLPTLAYYYAGNQLVDEGPLSFYGDNNYIFYTIAKIYQSASNTRIFIGGQGPFQNAYMSLLFTRGLGSNSFLSGPYNTVPNSAFYYADNSQFSTIYGSSNEITSIHPGRDYDEFFIGYDSGVLRSFPSNYYVYGGGYAVSIGTSQNHNRNIFANRSNNGVYISLSYSSDYPYTGNGTGNFEYSPSYNVQSQFFVPIINIAPVSWGSSVLLTSNDHYTVANTIYENTYIKAK